MNTYLVCFAQKVTKKLLSPVEEIKADRQYTAMVKMYCKYPQMRLEVVENRAYIDIEEVK